MNNLETLKNIRKTRQGTKTNKTKNTTQIIKTMSNTDPTK